MKKLLGSILVLVMVLVGGFNTAEACNSTAWEGGGVTIICDNGDDQPRCWEGDCVIYEYNGVISQECKTFCNFYCYISNYQLECDGDGCWTIGEAFCRVDGGPHQVK